MRFYTFSLSVLLAACGVIASQRGATARNFIENVDTKTTALQQQIAQAQEGLVEGFVTYPSEVTPAMSVCAQSLSNLYLMSCIETPNDWQGQPVSFKMSLAPGDYYFFAYELNEPEASLRYYSNSPSVYRGNGQPNVVSVRSGRTVSDVYPGHYRTCDNYPDICITPPGFGADGATASEPSNSSDEQLTLRQQSQKLFAESVEAYESRNYIEAADKFAESIDLMSQDPQGAEILSNIINNTPIAGDLKGLFEAVTGEDSLTGAPLAWWERVITAVPFDRPVAALWNAAKAKVRGAPSTSAVQPPNSTSNSGGGVDQSVSARGNPNVAFNPTLPDGISRNDLSNNTLTASVPKKTRVQADTVNATAEQYGSSYPPFKPGTQINVHEVEETAAFVRFYGGDSSAQGNFMMRLEDIEGLTPAQIRDRFALPPGNTMENMVIVKVKPGATLNSGPANPHPEWGNGEGTQYYLNGQFDRSTVESIVEVQNW